jgi:hypothetical protein
MGIAHCQVVIPSYTNLPADSVVNTWTFSGSGTAIDVATAATPNLKTFYIGNGGVALTGYFSQDLQTSSILFKWYRLSDTSATTPDVTGPGVGHGSPILTVPVSGASGSGTPLPDQCAVALSMHGVTHDLAEHSGPGPRPAARHRGRVFLGPFGTGAVGVDTANHGAVVIPGLMNYLKDGATALMSDTTGTNDLSIWSRKNNAVYSVVGGFIDDRFDTQRRRAHKSTFRTLFGIPG